MKFLVGATSSKPRIQLRHCRRSLSFEEVLDGGEKLVSPFDVGIVAAFLEENAPDFR